VPRRILAVLAVCCIGVTAAEPHRWTATWQSGIAQTMQLSLGGLFNAGPAEQNRLAAVRSGVLRSSDSLQLYSWSTTDLRTGSTDVDVGARYRVPVRTLARGKIVAGGGLEHWRFPSVLGGTNDIVADSYLGWTGGERIPVTISANAKTLVRSDLCRGTFLNVQTLLSHRIAGWRSARLSLQHGPSYVYSWNLYGRSGHRVFRYVISPQLSFSSWLVEGTLRPQAGLQPAIPDNRFWSIGIGRRFGV
jgi:hypothetical protein